MRPARRRLLAAGLGLAALVASSQAWAAPGTGPATHPLVHFDAQQFGRAWAAVRARPARALPGARVLVLPHHWLAGPLILGPLRDLAATRTVRRVIVVGPDHRNAAPAAAASSDWTWSTPFGSLGADAAAVGRLVAAGLVRRAPAFLTGEHSVAGLMPALARVLPGVRVVPITLRGDVPPAEVDALAEGLAPLMADEATVLVAAVDFAHDVPVAQVAGLNAESIAALRRLDRRRVMDWGNEHLDAPEVIRLAMAVAGRQGATDFQLLDATDASRFGAPASQPVTSYVVGYFR